jgi:hypothetical protein
MRGLIITGIEPNGAWYLLVPASRLPTNSHNRLRPSRRASEFASLSPAVFESRTRLVEALAPHRSKKPNMKRKLRGGVADPDVTLANYVYTHMDWDTTSESPINEFVRAYIYVMLY